MRWMTILLAASFLTLVVPATPASATCYDVTEDGERIVGACTGETCNGLYVYDGLAGYCFYGPCTVFYFLGFVQELELCPT